MTPEPLICSAKSTPACSCTILCYSVTALNATAFLSQELRSHNLLTDASANPNQTAVIRNSELLLAYATSETAHKP